MIGTSRQPDCSLYRADIGREPFILSLCHAHGILYVSQAPLLSAWSGLRSCDSVLYVPMARTDSHRSSVSSQPPSHPFDPFPSTLPGCFINADLLCIWPAMSGAPTRQVQCLIITAAGGGEIHALDPCNYMHQSTGSHGNTGSCTSRVYELLRGANKAAAPFPNASAELPNMLCSWPACLQRSKVANHRFLTVRGSTLELPVS